MKLLFYPQMPKSFSKITDVCSRLKLQIIDMPCNHDVSGVTAAIHWNYNTICPADDLLKLLSKQFPVINLKVDNLSKSYVDKIFTKIFGYSTMIDPGQSFGHCIEKSEKQAAHDARIVRLPVLRKPGFIYQKIFDSRSTFESYDELRICVFKKTIPFLFLKSRPVLNPIKGFDKATFIENPDSYLSKDEQSLIIKFSSEFGLDLGELDVLRNNSDGKIYIIDVNNMPGDLLFRRMDRWDANNAREIYANYFKSNFLS